MKEIRLIKKLKTQMRKLDDEIIDTHSVMTEYQRLYSEQKKERNRINDEIENMKKGELKVTEHAMLRYFERILGFDLEAIEEKILEPISEAQKKLGSGTYGCQDFKVVIKENTIITVIL